MVVEESELNDLSDDADYAASVREGSSSIMVENKGTSSNGLENAETVYFKDNVTIHPTQFASERISGRLKLIKQESSLFMVWIPYKGQQSNLRLSEKDRELYTIKNLALADVRSIRRHAPTIGWQYIIVVLSSGLAFPPLYFYNGGVKEFLAMIKQHVLIVRSAGDSNTFLVNDHLNPLQRTLSSLELPRFISVAKESSALSQADPTSYIQHEIDGAGDSVPNISKFTERPKLNIHDPAHDLSMQVLEKFSLVTKFARATTSQLFHDIHSNDFHDRINKHHVPVLDDHNNISKDQDHLDQNTLPLDDSQEFDKLSLVWGKPRQPSIGLEEWGTFLDCDGRVSDSEALKKRIFYGGIDGAIRKVLWPFLLGYHSYDSTCSEREHLKAAKKLEYENVKQQWKSIGPQQAKKFTKYRERKGLIEKDVVRTDRLLPFYDGDDNPNLDILHDILMTYSFYNFDLGYCQGMGDFLSPILFVMESESEAFWCFAALMERLGPNFNSDQNGMHTQLFALSKLVELLDSQLHNYFQQNDCLNYFFCFRWILIQFKREFEFEEVLRLWEVLWSHYLSEHMHLYVCVAVLKRHRGRILGEHMDFDTLLKFINELSGHIELEVILRDAEALCVCAGENGAACIPPGTPPSLPVENLGDSLYPEQDDVL